MCFIGPCSHCSVTICLDKDEAKTIWASRNGDYLLALIEKQLFEE